MRPDIQFLRERFDYFNSLIFTPQLPAVRLRISNGKRQLGCFRYPRKRPASSEQALALCSLSLSNVYDREQAELEDVIIHEMIHFCVWLNRIDEPSHGPEFQRLMNTINSRFGRNIRISENLSEEIKASDTREKLHIIVAVDMPDGNKAFACTTQSAVPFINKVLYDNNLPHRWYVSLDPWFNSYPKVRTPKLFNITEENYRTHILPARKVE